MKPDKFHYHALPLPKITPTSVLDLACPAKFWTLRVLKQWPPRQPNSFGAFGKALHSVLRDVYDPSSPARPDTANLDMYIDNAMREHRYADKAAEAADTRRISQMVRGYVAAEDDEDHADALGTISVERLLEHKIIYQGTPLFVLSARLDRLIVRPDEPNVLIIRDYKTGNSPVPLESSFCQLWAAKLKFGKRFDSFRLEIDQVDNDGRIERRVVEPCQCRGVHRWIMERAAAVLTATEHAEEPSQQACTWCCRANDCPAVQGGTARLEDDPFGDA